MKTGECPKCKGTNIWMQPYPNAQHFFFPLTDWRAMAVELYCCADCGFFEQYITKENLEDPTKLDRLKRKLIYVKPSPEQKN